MPVTCLRFAPTSQDAPAELPGGCDQMRLREELERDASALRRLIAKMQKHEAWKALGVPSFDMLCTTQLRLSSDEVDAVLKARKGQTVGAVLRKVGRPKAGEGNDSNRSISAGSGPAYLAARSGRRHPPRACRHRRRAEPDRGSSEY